MPRLRARIVLACAVYVAALVAANLLVARFGPAATPVIGFFLIGLDLTLRDALHDAWAGRGLWPRMLALIGSAGALSWALDPASGRIALASLIAFVAAALADALVYQALRRSRRFGGWLMRANGSNAAGAAVDSLLFPLLAFGALMPSISAAQFGAKLAGGFLWSLLLRAGAGAQQQPLR
jgi:uncharacterized PurR-regulated membrane protein YhhQ (DUF165 family)